jgi:aspartate dehydrogenase
MLGEPVVLYEGDAAPAAQKYPKNLNVAATLALAGVGMQATQVKVVADPGITTNQHTIHVDSPLGTLTTKLVNQPSPGNPKTSWIVAQSVLAVVQRQVARIVVGSSTGHAVDEAVRAIRSRRGTRPTPASSGFATA